MALFCAFSGLGCGWGWGNRLPLGSHSFFCSTLGVRDGLWFSSCGRALSAVGLACFCLRRARASKNLKPISWCPLVFFGRLFVGVGLSEFSLGLLCVIFCLRGGDRGSVLLSLRVEFCCLAFWGHAIICLAFSVFCFCVSGGRENLLVCLWDFCFVSLLPFWGEIVELVALSFLFRVGLAQFFVGMSIN